MPINKIAYSSLEVERENYINVLRAGQLISDIGWRIYNDASSIPVDGTGGTTNITWSQNTSNPLSGDSDLRLVKDANNRQGEGVSIDFTVSNRHLAKVLQITLDSELISGTFATGDLKFYIIANPGSSNILIEPVNVNLQLGIANQRIRHIASFQTDISITSYRLCIHVSSTSTSAYTVDFNNFKVWEPTQSVGAIITDWVSYTPSFTNMGGSPTSSLIWRRNGSNLEIKGDFTTGSSVPAQVGTMSLPIGLVPTFSTVQQIGFGIRSTGTANQANIITNTSTPNLVNFSLDGTANALTAFNTSSIFSSGERVSVSISVPIAGWGSSVAMSSDTGDSRVVAARYTNATVSSTVLVYQTRDYDTHGAYSNGVFTAPVNGYYRYCLVLRPSFNSQVVAQINELDFEVIMDGYNTSYTYNAISQVYLNAGQRLRFTLIGGSGLSSQLSNQSFSIERISAGSQVLSASETVAARYTTDTAQNNSVIVCEDKDFDTHNAYSITTGKYTVPMSGVYRISGQITNYNSGYLYADIRKNNDVIICRDLIQLSSANYMTASPNLVTKLIAGDTVWLWAYTSGTMQVDAGYRNMFCIERIGL